MKGAIYIRESNSLGHLVADQVAACRRRAKLRRIEILPTNVFVDLDSPASRRQHELEALKEAIVRREVQVVLITDLARLGRSSAAVNDLLALFRLAGVTVLCADEVLS